MTNPVTFPARSMPFKSVHEDLDELIERFADDLKRQVIYFPEFEGLPVEICEYGVFVRTNWVDLWHRPKGAELPVYFDSYLTLEGAFQAACGMVIEENRTSVERGPEATEAQVDSSDDDPGLDAKSRPPTHVWKIAYRE